MKPEPIIRSLLLIITALIFSLPLQAADQDIAGLKLGMSLQEAEAAMRAFDPEFEIYKVERYYTYSDGVQNFNTDSFIWHIKGTRHGVRSSEGTIEAFFSPPPQAPRASVNENPPTRDQFRAALVNKYGEPEAEDNIALRWRVRPGESACIREEFSFIVGIALDPESSTRSLLEQMYAFDPENQTRDLSKCPAYLMYGLGGGDVIGSVPAVLSDLAIAGTSEQAAMAWLADLEAKAINAREAKGKTPRL